MPQSGETISTPDPTPKISLAESHTEVQTPLGTPLEKKLVEEIDNRINAKLQDLQIKYTEVLGVFVALFTFVSITIQVFSRISSLNNAILFIVLIFFCLSGFVYILHLILSGNNSPERVLFGIIIICSLIAVLFASFLPNAPLSKEETTEILSLKERVLKIETILDSSISK